MFLSLQLSPYFWNSITRYPPNVAGYQTLTKTKMPARSITFSPLARCVQQTHLRQADAVQQWLVDKWMGL